MVINKKVGTKCTVCYTEQLGHEGKLDVYVSEDGSEELEHYIIGARGFKFCGLGLQVHPKESSVSNIFEGSCNEEGTGAWRDVFEGVSKISASEVMKKIDITYSAVQK